MQLYLLLNTDCNLNCNFCIRGKKTTHDYLDLHSLKRVLQTNDFSDYHLLITGGEPTLHPDLPQIISLCQSHFKGVSINTNGTISSWIKECDNKHFHVQISLDGTEQFHNQLRGNGKTDVYSRITNTIGILNQYNISYNISTTVGNNNYDDVKTLCRQISALHNLKYWKVSPILPFGCADKSNVLSIAQWNDLVYYLLDNAEVRLSIKRLFDFDLLDRYLKCNPDNFSFNKSNCGDVKYKIYVYPDFTVYPCTCLTDFPIGNLLKHTLHEILQSDKAEKFRDYRVNEESPCFSCKYLTVCNGGRIGMSYHFFHELGKGDYRCPLIQEKLHIIS